MRIMFKLVFLISYPIAMHFIANEIADYFNFDAVRTNFFTVYAILALIIFEKDFEK